VLDRWTLLGSRSRSWHLLVALAFVDPSPARAAPDPSTAETRFVRGAQEWSLAVGQGTAFELFGTAGSDLEDVEYAALVPRWGMGLSDRLGDGAWYRGNLELLAEGAFLYAYEPTGGFAWGGTLALRWNFLASERIVPFVTLGAGLVDLEFDLAHQADGINFTPQGGVGIHYRASRRTAFTAEWRLHHISNADLREDNDGINGGLLLIGVSYFPE
jgi:hypothetical protein